jgi:hypothetical protein
MPPRRWITTFITRLSGRPRWMGWLPWGTHILEHSTFIALDTSLI